MIRISLLLPMAVMSMAACARPELSPRAATEQAEEDAVYLAALEALYRDDPIVVLSRTVLANPWLAEDAVRPRDRHAIPVDAELVAAYLARSKTRRNLRPKALAARRGTIVVAKTVLDRIQEQEREWFWREFRARYPGAAGLVSLSRVGFSRDGTRAMVVAHHTCSFPCRSDGPGLVVLARRDGRWMVEIPVVARN